VFRAVLGVRLIVGQSAPAQDRQGEFHMAKEAVLAGYKKISPDDTYFYAVPDPAGRIRGYVVENLPGRCLAGLHHYEGRNYRKVRVTVQTSAGPVKAFAYVANLAQLQHSFGWRFHDPFKQEVLLRNKIEKILLEDQASRLHTSDKFSRLALRELHGLTVRDLVRQHFEAGGISNFIIHNAIRQEPLREFGQLPSQDDAADFLPGYLALLVRQVLFNQLEDRIRADFRFELDGLQISDRYYERTVSILAALRLLNDQPMLLDLLTRKASVELPLDRTPLIECVRWSVQAADTVYDQAAAKAQLEFIRRNMRAGYVPLGAELEFSNVGHTVISDPEAAAVRDRQYAGFLYFRDFALDILTWKLGGHVDDHRVKFSDQRRRGFFELALGSLSVAESISKPITDDPWLLGELIQAGMRFYPVRPHSLHISLQIRSFTKAMDNHPLPLGVLKSLFALAGQPVRSDEGRVQISRIAGEEIIRASPDIQMLFSQVSRRHSTAMDSPLTQGRWVQQFKFLRLGPDINYERVILALKGLQMHYKCGSFLTAQQYRAHPALREVFGELLAWGQDVSPLTAGEQADFLSGVQAGLLRERKGRPAHSRDYINQCLEGLKSDLETFNQSLHH
jgi:gamma-glutamylcyclotransferase (GGCT)/AIG2-like uncharacterized protein YtfP